MIEYAASILSIGILDFKKESEARRLFDSLKQHLRIPATIVYCHDGPPDQYVKDLYDEGRIDTLVYSKENQGCGIQTRQLFQACMTPYILYCQVDQFLLRPFGVPQLQTCLESLKQPDVLYIDLAGNQGRGRPSERALFMERKRYLEIPDIDSVIGGPGRYAQYRWTEKHLQEYMQTNGLKFLTANPTVFGDNGKWSRRTYDGDTGQTLHSTDEKVLIITKPFQQRQDGYPNLNLTDEEWQEVLEGRWPVEGKVPEHDKPSSFKVW